MLRRINTFLTSQKNKTPCKSTTYKVFAVPRAGVEPARVAPLVFETSASTDSAIWAFQRAKVQLFFCKRQIFVRKNTKNMFFPLDRCIFVPVMHNQPTV